MTFADASANYKEADVIVFGVPFEDDEMSFRQGASKSPDFIRYAGWNYESYDIASGTDLQDVLIHDAGNVSLDDASTAMTDIIKDKKIPVVMGGAHSITPRLVSAINSADVGVVILDAHMDFRDEYNGSKWSHACTARRIFDVVGKERVLSIGVRSASKPEMAASKKLGFKYIFYSECTIENLVEQIPFEKIYLSIDMDVFDPCYAPGVSNPEPHGCGYELLDLIYGSSKRVIALDVVEVCPPYDDGRTALLAAKIIRDFICWKVA